MPSVTAGKDALEATFNLINRFEGAPLEMERRESSLVIAPTIEGGYSVTVYDEGQQAMIAAERWHAHYDDPMQTAFCAMWLFTPYYRIVHEFKGGLIAAAWLERYEADGWAAFEPAYFLNPENPKDWEAQVGGWTRTIRQQLVLPSPRPYEEISPGATLDPDGVPPNSIHGTVSESGDDSVGLMLY